MKPISIAVIPDHKHDYHTIIALCDDGSFWKIAIDCGEIGKQWEALGAPPLPAPRTASNSELCRSPAAYLGGERPNTEGKP
jgi:hypothetical protein